ncbi:MAG: DUF3108 domain-containing protein [Planctomycetota bacterium]
MNAFLLVATLALALQAEPRSPSGLSTEAAAKKDLLREDPRSWLPLDEALGFEVEVTVGPVRGLDLGSVTLVCAQTPLDEKSADKGAGTDAGKPRPIAAIDGLAKGGYLGRDVHHTIGVRWYEGTQPRIETFEKLKGSRVSNKESRVGEFDGVWKLEFRKDRHCKGCDDKAHFEDGFMPWSKPSHCDDCERGKHRVWKPHKYLDVPPDALDIVSALYFARGFLRSEARSTSISIVNQDELWQVRLERAGSRLIETRAGTFDCVRILLGPELAAGDGPGEKAAERFEALFGLHGNISVWVDRVQGIPVLIEGTAPFGPFDVHVKATLTSYRGS